jgi:hypothetical protein
MKYFGHIKRHEGLEKGIMEGHTPGRRKRGRPTRRWVHDITDDLQMSASLMIKWSSEGFVKGENFRQGHATEYINKEIIYENIEAITI